MERMERVPDELLDKLGAFYSSEYVRRCQPWVLGLPFYEWLQRELEKRKGGQ